MGNLTYLFKSHLLYTQYLCFFQILYWLPRKQNDTWNNSQSHKHFNISFIQIYLLELHLLNNKSLCYSNPLFSPSYLYNYTNVFIKYSHVHYFYIGKIESSLLFVCVCVHKKQLQFYSFLDVGLLETILFNGSS